MSIPPAGFNASGPPVPPLKHRKDKTHGDAASRTRMASWNVNRKRALNTLVDAANKEQLDKHGQQGRSPASSLASLVTTEGSEHGTPPGSPKSGSPSSILQALAKITPRSRGIFSGILGLKKRPRDAVDDSPKDVLEKRKKFFSCDEEVEQQPGSSFHFEGFHAELYRLADAKQYIPIHLFTLANLTIIQREGDTLPMKKIQDRGSGKTTVLDVSNTRFGKEENLTELQWRDASPRYVDFLLSLRTTPGGLVDPTWSKRWHDHFLFFHNLVDFSVVFEAILAMDIKLRIDYHNSDKGFKFSQPYYASELSSTKERLRDERDCKWEEEYARLCSQLATQQSSRSLASSFRQGTGKIMSSFRRSDAGTSSPDTAVCLICARRGHHVHQCKFNSFESGQPTKCVFVPGDRGGIAPKSGTEKLCILWNVSHDRGTHCSHGIPPLHICSFCLAHDHHTFSWRCTTEPKPVSSST